MNNFNNLPTTQFGKQGESKIAMWMRWRGSCVLPVYEKEIDEGKGPQLFLPDRELIAPDLFAFNHENVWWIEAKHKSVFSWHWKTGKWVTGIDLRHYQDYLVVDEMTPWPVWLLFLHRFDRINKRNEPWPCPTGLFGRPIDFLQLHENHKSEPRQGETGWGRSGMVYWAYETLLELATLEEVEAASKELVK